ncbi:hypothetical protein EKO27_g428 [Xylaria grammica]|uniref:Uncharacterized protein n=1 Tax=Xylaria grammica TaxID=363999 RepID=A0A439DJT9_9PEZI|nr:hypothetical protein EKO27_g428 [Xylaria grammica]
MTVTTEPEALLSHLHKTDGSATYSFAGYTVIGAVNGPIEAQKRDELPEEAIIDVIVRPSAGVGVTPENEYVNGKLVRANVNLPVLPALLQTATLSLLSASLPMTATLTSTSLAIISEDGRQQTITNPTARQIEQSQSFHVLAFTSQNELLLAESEGTFTMKEWDDVYSAAYGQCCTTAAVGDTDTLMDEGLPTDAGLMRFVRSTVEQQTASDLYWK